MRAIYQYLLILLLLTSLCLYGQGGWKAKYLMQHSALSTAYQAIEAPNGNFIVLGQVKDTLKNASLLAVIGSDSEGKFLWRKDYGGSINYMTELFAPRCLIQDKNNFYRATWIWDNVNDYGSALIKFDYNGDTLWQKKFYSKESKILLYFFACAKSCDGGFLLTGILEDFNKIGRYILLLKTDINGNELWRKKIVKATAPSVHTGQAIIQDSATKKIIITGFQLIGDSTYGENYSSILFCDSLGNLLDQKTFNNAGGGSFAEVIQLRDKTFLTCGAWKTNGVGTNTFYKSMLVKFDIDGDVIWSKIFPDVWIYNRINYLHELPSGDLVLQGVVDSAHHPDKLIEPQILRTDKNGNIKWKRYIGSAYGYQYGFEFCRSFNSTSDGGFVLTSDFWMAPNPRFFSIIKVDSNACDTTEAYCKSVISDVGSFYKLTGIEFNVFPNPAKEAVSVSLEGEIKGFEIQIMDLSGRILHASKVRQSPMSIDLSLFPEGTYLLRLSYNGQAVETRKLVILR